MGGTVGAASTTVGSTSCSVTASSFSASRAPTTLISPLVASASHAPHCSKRGALPAKFADMVPTTVILTKATVVNEGRSHSFRHLVRSGAWHDVHYDWWFLGSLPPRSNPHGQMTDFCGIHLNGVCHCHCHSRAP